MDRRTDVALLLGRLGLGAIFLLSGVGKLTSWDGRRARREAFGAGRLAPVAVAASTLGPAASRSAR